MSRILPAMLFLLLAACAGVRPTDIGVVDAALTPCPRSPNCVSSGAEDELHRVEPLELLVPPERGWEEARRALLTLPATTIVIEREDYLHAESTSALMGFVDDLELYLEPSGQRIQIRSASRLGYGDAGVNRARVETLRAALVAAGIVKPGP